ncbi:13798_t:CDS:2 [Funneliformis geosporum]|uniref:18407_t:CDS:1 n=1 Tax=Funneliformis geosporum TaxID=1117311 RepID=A0A9W4SGT8_9GLOM|nr:13798_t:CDS:2 [Funneliformis geosporum]CAI2166564.1 18407_t:CDS:2 [Funneliformis geosporum]
MSSSVDPSISTPSTTINESSIGTENTRTGRNNKSKGPNPNERRELATKNESQSNSSILDSNQSNAASNSETNRFRSKNPKNPQSVDRNNNEPKIDESDPKGKRPIVSITEASSSNLRTSLHHMRPKNSSINKFPKEIKDVLTSITHGLSTSTYECMICCENIRPYNKTWFCGVCWAVFHLNCTQKWANKSFNDSTSWRCPGCQNRCDVIPEVYKCFCGKTENPSNNRYFTPHSCGNVCGRKRDCPHDCTLLCHPGPCPPCSAMAPTQYCYCGRKTFRLRCIDTDYDNGKSCGEICGQLLGCGKHSCEKECHDETCPKCNIIEIQKCYCGQTEREARCSDGIAIHCYEECNGESSTWTGFFSCKNACSRLLECGHHSCAKECHPVTGDVEPCPLDPSRVQTCPCGSKSIISLLGHERLSCTEEIPLCDNICKKSLSCGHECQGTCHHGDCKPCNVRIRVKCRCGNMEYERICFEVVGETGEPPICDKICNGVRNCGRHQCVTRCCPSANKPKKRRGETQDDDDENHRCPLICGKKLQCGNHFCQLLCHREYCMNCLEASFEELTCPCGRTKIEPPIPCGFKIPSCPYSCIRNRECGHSDIAHPCHSDEEPCPPCPFLVNKKCMCGKSEVRNVPCHRTNVSCGQVCDLPVNCGGHRCKRTCHSGDCLVTNQSTSGKCIQTCGKPRKVCGHPCSAQCHAPARCPEDVPCRVKIVINCKCGHLSQEVSCNVTAENGLEKKIRQLTCNDFCALAERNKKLADALEITDRVGDGPFIKAVPEYEEDLFKYFAVNKEWAKNIEKTLGDFIMKSEKPTLNLAPMKSPHRKFIHMLCVHYRLSSEGVDVEPMRSVVVKKKADTIIPPILLSQAYYNYNNKSSNSAASTTALEQLVRKPKQPVNAIYLVELQFGITIEELQKVIEPLMGRCKFQIKWVSDADAIILPSVGSSIHMDELENFLVKLKFLFKDLIIPKGIAAWVELCWVNSKFEVVWRDRVKILNNVNGPAKNMNEGHPRIPLVPSVPSSIRNINPFEILSNASNNTSSGTTKGGASIWDIGIGSSSSSSGNNNNKSSSLKKQPPTVHSVNEEDIVDDWELICDE